MTRTHDSIRYIRPKKGEGSRNHSHGTKFETLSEYLKSYFDRHMAQSNPNSLYNGPKNAL